MNRYSNGSCLAALVALAIFVGGLMWIARGIVSDYCSWSNWQAWECERARAVMEWTP